MGCDIHLWVEARKSLLHAWHPAFPQAPCLVRTMGLLETKDQV